MNEQPKLAEAEFFLSKMSSEEANVREVFEHYLSAFLTSARSVPQYALEEVGGNLQGQSWYEGCMQSSTILQFFKDKRDINIHVEPIKPSKRFEVEIRDSMHLSDSVSIESKDKDGNVTRKSVHGEKPSTAQSVTETIVSSEYRFSDWHGGESLMTLARMYVDELRNLIADGVARGFITP